MAYNWDNLDKDRNQIYDFVKEIRKEINSIWDEVLFDGDEIINCCAIPKEMHESIIKQIVEVIECKLYALEVTLERTPNCGLLGDFFGGKIYKYYKDKQFVGYLQESKTSP